MALCRQWAQDRSKDPNTKVGAAVYDPRTGGLFLGYNGFPAGFPDDVAIWDNRDPSSPDSKYHFVRHAEVNAVQKAMMALGRLEGCQLYVTHYPCHRCMVDAVLASGITDVLYGSDQHRDPLTERLAHTCGVRLTHLREPDAQEEVRTVL